MSDAATLVETTTRTLLVKLQGWDVSSSLSYCDAAIDVAAYRANRTDDSAWTMAFSAEALLGHLDDLSMSGTPEWEAASMAVDAYLQHA